MNGAVESSLDTSGKFTFIISMPGKESYNVIILTIKCLL